MDKEARGHSKVFNIKDYLLDKRVTGFKNRTHNRAIDRLVKDLDIQLNNPLKINSGVNKNLTIQFDSESRIKNLLFRMNLHDLIKIKFHNQKNKIIEDFFDSLTSR